MTIAIIQIVFGLFFLGEVCMRIFGWTYSSEFTYRICRPFPLIFWFSFSMMQGIIITFIYTVVGAVLTYRGIVGLI